jgi:energy-coupling factor transporter ATP-binding protein EcfA2
MKLEQQITAALAGRAGQRDFVDSLSRHWAGLISSVDTLLAAVADLTRGATTATARAGVHTTVFADIGTAFGADSDWQKRAAALSAKLAHGADRIGVLRQRVHRETVNIGVIGVTGAGKSTLLRKLTGLSQEHIPSNRYVSSTATPSRIFHIPATERSGAVLHLHIWPTFRDEVLQPLHEKAGLSAAAPASLEEFRAFRYPKDIPESRASSEQFTRRLRIAQASLPSYETLLTGNDVRIELDQLRPFVAYPADESEPERPYHAVRSADIYCPFPEVDAVQLGLVDLPGSGEAGLDVHMRFLADLRNHTDLLLIVRRPSKSPSTDQDWDAAQLADDAAAGVRRRDFAHLVINQDQDVPGDFFEQALARAHSDSADLGIDMRVCDIQRAEPSQVTKEVLAPILDLLAKRLAYMDRDAVAFVLAGLSGMAEEVRLLCGDLNLQFGTWKGMLPDQEKLRRARIRELKDEVSGALDRVRNEYDRLYDAGEPIAELQKQIELAGQDIRGWLTAGLGKGDRDKWIEAIGKAISGKGMGGELDRQYNGARERVVRVFNKIDASLDQAVARLYGEVAEALRGKLTSKIVPDDTEHAAALRGFAAITEADGARTLTNATKRLLSLRVDYGSIFLRVGRPVIRKIEWYSSEQQNSAGGGAGLAGQAVKMAGQAAGTAIGGQAGHAVGAALDEVASSALGASGQPGRNSWLSDHVQRAARPSPADAGTAVTSAAPSSAHPKKAGQDSNAAYWYDRLSATLEDVTSELEHEFHQEALRALRVLAAAVDLYKDTATTSPDIEVEYERVCPRAQQEIWPQDFDEAPAKVAANLERVRKQVQDTESAADQVSALANQATRLLSPRAVAGLARRARVQRVGEGDP